MFNKWRIVLLAALVLLAVGVGVLIVPNVAYSTASAVGYPYYTHPLRQELTIPIDWGTTSSDASILVTLPASYGCPTGILNTSFEDTAIDTGDSAKSAAALGEYCYMTPNDYGGTGIEANQITVYRNDIDGGTFTINLKSYVTFWWISNG